MKVIGDPRTNTTMKILKPGYCTPTRLGPSPPVVHSSTGLNCDAANLPGGSVISRTNVSFGTSNLSIAFPLLVGSMTDGRLRQIKPYCRGKTALNPNSLQRMA